MRSAENQQRAAIGNLVRVPSKTSSYKIVVCEILSCWWKRLDDECRVVTGKLEYQDCSVPERRPRVSFVAVSHLLTSRLHEKFIRRYLRRDFIHLNKTEYGIIVEELYSQ